MMGDPEDIPETPSIGGQRPAGEVPTEESLPAPTPAPQPVEQPTFQDRKRPR